MTITMTVPTNPPTAKRTIPIAPPDHACITTWAAAVMLETAAMLLTRRSADVPPCELDGRLECSTDPADPMCVACAVFCGLVYYGQLCSTTYKTGRLADAGELAQSSAAHARTLASGPDDLPAQLLAKARMWADRAVDTAAA